jgi:hypothetical protein
MKTYPRRLRALILSIPLMLLHPVSLYIDLAKTENRESANWFADFLGDYGLHMSPVSLLIRY